MDKNKRDTKTIIIKFLLLNKLLVELLIGFVFKLSSPIFII